MVSWSIHFHDKGGLIMHPYLCWVILVALDRRGNKSRCNKAFDRITFFLQKLRYLWYRRLYSVQVSEPKETIWGISNILISFLNFSILFFINKFWMFKSITLIGSSTYVGLWKPSSVYLCSHCTGRKWRSGSWQLRKKSWRCRGSFCFVSNRASSGGNYC